MKIKVNFKAGEPTLNGHVYPEEVLKKALDKKFEEPVFITSENTDGFKIDVSKIIGEAKKYKIKENNEIIIHAKVFEKYKDLFENKKIEITTYGFGEFEDDGKTIKDNFVLSHFFIAKDEK
jgi:hypothetical protein